MVQFNDRSTGEDVELEANTPQEDDDAHHAILQHIADLSRIARTQKNATTATTLDQLDTARESALSSMRSHSQGNLIAAQANMHSAAGYAKIAAESLGIPNGSSPAVEASMHIADKASDVSDDYQRKTGGTHFTVGRFN
jgi:predicted negative regulator of RcsB-dependent stress response